MAVFVLTAETVCCRRYCQVDPRDTWFATVPYEKEDADFKL